MSADMRLRHPERVRGAASMVAALGLVGCAVGLAVDPGRTYLSYLAAYVYGISLALGALCLVLITHATGARWFVVVRRPAEAIAGTMPVFALLFVPLLFGLPRIYPWVAPGPELAAVVAPKHAYLNVPFFVARAASYLAVWWWLVARLRRWSARRDDPAHAAESRPLLVSGLGLMVFGFTVTFAAFDWLMSLDPGWSSTAFGLYYFAGGLVGALGLMAVVVWALERDGVLAGRVGGSHYHALGRLTLTFVVFWAYIAYAQGFLIWIADVPREAEWYLRRWHDGWSTVLIALAVGHFVLPFFALLSRSLKRNGPALAAIGAWLLLMHYVDVFWLVLPALRGAPAAVRWQDAAALLAVIGVAVAFGVRQLSATTVVPIHDPDLAASLGYESA
jgi:hypothetical protein